MLFLVTGDDGRDAAGKAGGITNTVSDNLIEHASKINRKVVVVNYY